MFAIETVFVAFSIILTQGSYSFSIIPHILGGIADFFGFIVLLIIGALIIVLIVGLAIVFLPAIIVAVVVYFLTGSFFYAGIAFLIIALISLVSLATK